MAFSSSFNYTDTVTAASIIALALRRLGVLDPDEPVGTTEQANALVVLNLILKEWPGRGADVWLRDTAYLFLTSKTKATYNSATDYIIATHYTTTLSASAATSASTITVTSASLITASDLIFVKLSDGTIHATTVNGAPAGSTVTLTTALPSVAATGAYVFTANPLNRLLYRMEHLVSARTMQSTADTVLADKGGIANEIQVVGDTDWHSTTSVRLQVGRPTKIFHRKLFNSNELNIWPVGGDQNVDRIELVGVFPIQDLDQSSDNLLLPPEGFNCVAWQLAAEMAPEYGLTEREIGRLWQIAEAKFSQVLDANREDAPVAFQVDNRPRG